MPYTLTVSGSTAVPTNNPLLNRKVLDELAYELDVLIAAGHGPIRVTNRGQKGVDRIVAAAVAQLRYAGVHYFNARGFDTDTMLRHSQSVLVLTDGTKTILGHSCKKLRKKVRVVPIVAGFKKTAPQADYIEESGPVPGLGVKAVAPGSVEAEERAGEGTLIPTDLLTISTPASHKEVTLVRIGETIRKFESFEAAYNYAEGNPEAEFVSVTTNTTEA